MALALSCFLDLPLLQYSCMFHLLGLVSVISVLFGVLVILRPEIIDWLVGGFFILSGIIGVGFAWQARSFFGSFRKR